MEEITKILVDEHKNILKLVGVLERECNAIETGKEIDQTFFINAIDFIKNYADKFHHAKEEDILFYEFNKSAEEGCTHCNPIQQMLVEHDEGRASVKLMTEGLESNDKKKLVYGARGYSQLIHEHIFKEDNILYPMSEDALSKKTKSEMLEKYEKIAKEREKEIERYIKFAEESGKK
ncbi:MAG: hemerythrin domain-containing protein [Nanoarchaeota archaeon]|nr:hemerythrin domain-containing protein [Nanoarchaeota archaeon]